MWPRLRFLLIPESNLNLISLTWLDCIPVNVVLVRYIELVLKFKLTCLLEPEQRGV